MMFDIADLIIRLRGNPANGRWATKAESASALEQQQQRIDALEAVLNGLVVAVMEMHHDNTKGDFELSNLARLDLDACVDIARNKAGNLLL
jgi:hypothetical protein